MKLPGENGWEFLSRLKSDPTTSNIPVIVATILEDKQKAFELGAEDFCSKPIPSEWLLNAIHKWGIKSKKSTILIADDEEVWRYLLRDALSEGGYNVVEAKNGVECLKLMRQKKPDLVFLDIIMPEMDGFEVLAEMRLDPTLRDIPVVITTSKTLDEQEKEYISSRLVSILPKRTIDKDKVLATIVEHLKEKVVQNKPSQN
ncbi:MAG: response regulator [Verrucomicrobiia bacterium]